MVYCESPENQKEIKKPSGKSLHIWAKNQLALDVYERFWKSQLTIETRHFLLFFESFLEFCHFIQLWKITIFLQHFFGVFSSLRH